MKSLNRSRAKRKKLKRKRSKVKMRMETVMRQLEKLKKNSVMMEILSRTLILMMTETTLTWLTPMMMKQHTSSTLSKYGVLAFCLPLSLGASFADQNFPFIHFGIMSSFCYHPTL